MQMRFGASSMSYKPLKITSWLASPVAGNPNLPLDGILLFQSLEAAFGPPGVLVPRAVPEYDPDIVPLARVYSPDGTDWMYNCSFAIWAEYVEHAQYWNKSWDSGLDRIVEGKKTITISKGKFKAYHNQMICRHAHHITWYCVGDRDQIAELLPENIGYKREIGYSHILRWSVQVIDEMPDLLTGNNGLPMRAIPMAWLKQFPIQANMARHTYRPPYWNNIEAVDCLIP